MQPILESARIFKGLLCNLFAITLEDKLEQLKPGFVAFCFCDW